MALQFHDQCGNHISLPAHPKRIVSLVPSQTELLFDLGLESRVVGITKYCVHPAHWLHHKTIVGGTKNFDVKVIDEINPDLIIANKEENYEDGIRQLMKKHPVWMSDIFNLEAAIQMIHSIGSMTATQDQAQKIIGDIATEFTKMKLAVEHTVLYLIWRKPWMGVAGNTFIDSMLKTVGLKNILEQRTRYPELTLDEIRFLDPEMIFLSSEPYPFKEKHVIELQQVLPEAKILLVDGEMFSWYGSRLIKAPAYFNDLPLSRR
jgi:ABC-type Fe3+-hydroxamate transport system substrate-binding protein